MAQHWRLKTSTGGNHQHSIGKYCVDNGVAAMGWGLWKIHPQLASGKITINSFDDYAYYNAMSSKYDNKQIGNVRRLASETQKGDVIWIRNEYDEQYYRSVLPEDGSKLYRYDFSDNAGNYDACNRLVGLKWVQVDNNDIPEKVWRAFQGPGQTFCRITYYEDYV